MKLFFDLRATVEGVDEKLIEMVHEMVALVNKIEITPAIHTLTDTNRSKQHGKREDEKKKEEKGTVEVKRSDKEYEIYMKRKQKKHTKMVK